ncbi:MAG: nucleoside-diphosphate sugar epimerase/dehydratase, partial [Gammaproteobacteria bacterium]
MTVNRILSLPRNLKRVIVLSLDLIIIPFALWASFSLRLGVLFTPDDLVFIPEESRGDVIYLFFLAPLIAIPIFVRLGLYRAIIRYIGFVAMWTIIKATSLYTLVFGTIILLGGIAGVPRSVILINWLMVVLLAGTTRALARWWLTGSFNRKSDSGSRSKVVIYGAGDAGVQIAAALRNSPNMEPAAFIDDNKALQGSYIEGFRVYPFRKLSSLIDEQGVSEVLIAMPSVSRARRSQVIAMLEPYTVHVRTVPGLNDLASGKLKVDDIREVGINDLLGRIPVEPDQELLNANTNRKVVMVTGAGGSIGSELCRQIVKQDPAALILCERSERDLYLIENEMLETVEELYPGKENRVTPILASILDQNRMEAVCKAFGVETIYHAAAYKHVPMVEKNPSEAVRNNVLGTCCMAQAAIEAGVETFVLISTDKAVRPTSTMGATKRFAEMILQQLAKQPNIKTRFTMVRFGNVLDSSGSVIPLFRSQIRNGGPVTVTDPRIIRYFMTIPEAAQLVIQAGAMGAGGDVFVLDMGQPVKILDMAKRLIHLSGLEVKDEENPDGDIEIVYTGLRPGEKLYEELLIGENDQPTRHPLIMTASEESLPWNTLRGYIEQFEAAIETHDVDKCRALLVESVKGFVPQCDVADLVQERRA